MFRYACQEGYHLYGDRVEEEGCGGGSGGAEIPSVCALDATRHEWTAVTLSSGNFPEKAVDDDDSGVHGGDFAGLGDECPRMIHRLLAFTFGCPFYCMQEKGNAAYGWSITWKFILLKRVPLT